MTGLDGATGTVEYRTEAGDADGADVRVVLRDADGAEVAAGSGASGTLTVPNVHRWAPGDGYLYDLEVQLVDGGGLRCWTATTRASACGRSRCDGTRFLVNGEPVYFTGFGMHEDHAVLGKGHNDAHMLHDFALLEWIGANSFRTSHYPYSEDVLDYADRRGIVRHRRDRGRRAQHGPRRRDLRCPGLHHVLRRRRSTTQTREVHAQAIRELVARDKNHPSVVLWSIANEPESDTEGAENYFRPLFELTRELDPTRPVGFVNVMLAPYGKCRVSQFADVLMLNRYYGWYVDTGDLRRRRAGLGGGAARLGQRGQADHHHRVRRRHLSRACTPCPRSRGARSTRSSTST